MKTCTTPVPFETLAAWWTGELSADEAARVEEHFFSCDACADASSRLATLASGVHEQIPPVISHAQRARLIAGGTRIRITPVDAGVEADADFGYDVDLLVHALRADLSRAERVDVDIVRKDAPEPIQLHAVPFDAQAGEVLICCQRHYQQMSAFDPVFRVHVVEGGERRVVGEYLVHHIWP
jgi:hypothetical protein